MKWFLIFLFTISFKVAVSQDNDPVALNDTVYTVNMQTTIIKPMINDYHPDGYGFYIYNVKTPEYGQRQYNDSTIFYMPDMFTGLDTMVYRIREVDGTDKSDYATIFIHVEENYDHPNAIDDTMNALQLVPTYLDLLQNDFDPNGDDISIFKIDQIGNHFGITIAPDSLGVIFTSKDPREEREAKFRYKIRETNTQGKAYSYWAYVHVNIAENPDLPIAQNDEVVIVGGSSLDIDVLLNDFNPTSYELEIDTTSSPRFGTVEIVNHQLRYTANFSDNGVDKIGYKVFYSNQPHIYDYAEVIINIESNPSCPVGLSDIGNGISGLEFFVNVLHNDYDPDGADIEIMDIRLPSYSNGILGAEPQGDSIKIYPLQNITINIDSLILWYRVNEIHNPASFSEYIEVVIVMEQSLDYPIFIDDTASAFAGYPFELDVFLNDQLNGWDPNNTILTGSLNHGYGSISDKLYFSPYTRSHGKVKLQYICFNPWGGYQSIGDIYIEIIEGQGVDSLSVNNINAGINYDGLLFSKTFEPSNGAVAGIFPHFEYPKGSRLHLIHNNSLWIGGKDQSGLLHFAGQTDKNKGRDFRYGPIANEYDGIEHYLKYCRIWKLNKDEVEHHKNNYWKEGYEVPEEILNWPGNGNISNGEADQLAPYFDLDDNGLYDPFAGDYPLIRGDQCLLFIINDDRTHSQTGGDALGVEIHGMAYAFANANDELLYNTIFVHYDIYNRSDNTYYDTYLGTWTNIDIGDNWDDFTGSHVGLSSYYGYNGKYFDGSSLSNGSYGVNPPAIGVTIVAGPYLDEDYEDNAIGGCDYSINGLNFGDGIIDNERYGLTAYNSPGYYGSPVYSNEYYNLMMNIWRDGTPMVYGGNGTVDNGEGPECYFMFPADSDPCNWGTNGVPPNGGYNVGDKFWTERDEYIMPYERKGLGVSGPFTFEPGDRQEIDIAFSAARGESGPQSSVNDLLNNLETLFQRVGQGEILIPADELLVDEYGSDLEKINIYPNPASSKINITTNNGFEGGSYTVYDCMGKNIVRGSLDASSDNEIDIQILPPGMYILQVNERGSIRMIKFVKM